MPSEHRMWMVLLVARHALCLQRYPRATYGQYSEAQREASRFALVNVRIAYGHLQTTVNRAGHSKMQRSEAQDSSALSLCLLRASCRCSAKLVRNCSSKLFDDPWASYTGRAYLHWQELLSGQDSRVLESQESVFETPIPIRDCAMCM
ncbi:hypothetical protein DFP72DRAFT_152705 [Ephemerocybe angulata]|uniref:Secreted protein n=1 Tax=Ephemerocybe angulata TaxID=980116 RepID=A0A8H6LUS7_9AGAR|nr:hypothetical protein DFP72DRAFT_152705 [Tulosesus angulatus]